MTSLVLLFSVSFHLSRWSPWPLSFKFFQVLMFFLAGSAHTLLHFMVFIPFVQLLPWWSNPTKLWCGLPLSSPEYAHVLTLNASGDGWGGVLDYNQSVQGLWTEPFRTWHINRLDMQAVWLALQHFNTSGLCYRVLLCWSEPTTPRLATLFTSSGALSLWSCVLMFWVLLHWCLSWVFSIHALFVLGRLNLMVNDLSQDNGLPSLSPVLVHQELSPHTCCGPTFPSVWAFVVRLVRLENQLQTSSLV